MYNKIINKREDFIIPRKASKQNLRDGSFEYLRSLTKQRIIQVRIVMRVHIPLDKADGNLSIKHITSICDIITNTVHLCFTINMHRME